MQTRKNMFGKALNQAILRRIMDRQFLFSKQKSAENLKIAFRNVSAYHSLHEVRRLTWADIFRRCMTQVYFPFNPLPDDKILDWSKLKQIAADIFQVHLKWKISTT